MSRRWIRRRRCEGSVRAELNVEYEAVEYEKNILRKSNEDIRREEPSVAGQNSDIHIISGSNLMHGLGEGIVPVAVQSIELLGLVERDDGDFAAVLDGDGVRHDDYLLEHGKEC